MQSTLSGGVHVMTHDGRKTQIPIRLYCKLLACIVLALFECPAVGQTSGVTGIKNVLMLYGEQNELRGLATFYRSPRSILTSCPIYISRFQEESNNQSPRARNRQMYRGKRIGMVAAAFSPSLDSSLAHAAEILPVFSKNWIPTAALIQLRELSIRDQNKWLIVGVVTLCVAEALIIIVLLIQRARRQRAEESRALSDERFAKAFRAGPDAFVISRRSDGIILDINDRWEQLFGFRREEVIGRTSLDLGMYVNPQDRLAFFKMIEEQGFVHDFETEVRSKAGEIRQVAVTAESITINNEPCIFVVIRDISKRKRAEEQLSLLQTITMDVVATEDLVGALEVVLQRVCEKTGWVLGQAWLPRADQTVLYCGPSCVCGEFDVVGFRAASDAVQFSPGVGLPGRVWKSKQPAWIEDVTLDENFPRAAIAAKAGLKAALGIPIMSGDEVIAIIEFFLREPRHEDERLVKVIAAVAAQLGIVIERKRAETELTETRAVLAHAGRLTAMGELAASIAHEVNQPLGAIIGNAEICLKWLGGTQPDLEQLREALTDIHSDGNRASEVIKRIRALVRKGMPQKTALDINEVVGEVVALVNQEAIRRQIRLRSRLSDSLPPVLGDRVQLQQVLINLMMNGIDAISSVEEGDRELVAETCPDDNGVRVAVRDCGPGVDVQEMEKLFNAFYTTKPDGMGMGLAISRSIINAHGGKLWASSNNGQGATFQFTLPAHREVPA